MSVVSLYSGYQKSRTERRRIKTTNPEKSHRIIYEEHLHQYAVKYYRNRIFTRIYIIVYLIIPHIIHACEVQKKIALRNSFLFIRQTRLTKSDFLEIHLKNICKNISVFFSLFVIKR